LLYLAVFYICTGIVFGTLNLFGTPRGLAFTSVLLPPAVLSPRLGAWAETWDVWLAALCAQILIGGIFVSLQRRTLADLSTPGRLPIPAPGAAWPSPLWRAASPATTWSWISPLVASICRPCRSNPRPRRSVTRPPASSTSSAPAAKSHACGPTSQ